MPLAVVAFDTFTDTVGQELRLHTPDLNIAGWEYMGSWQTLLGGPASDPSRVQRQSSGGSQYVRSTADVAGIVFTGPFTVFAKMVKGAVDQAGADGLIGFFVRGSGSAAPYDGEGVWVGFERTDASNANVVARRVNAGGGVAETLVWGNVAIGGATQKEFTCDVAADGITLTMTVADAFTGLNPIALGNVVLGADIRDADHQRVGISNNITGSGATDIYNYDLLQDALLLNPWSECDPCAGPTTWADGDCPVEPAAAFSAGFEDGGFQ